MSGIRLFLSGDVMTGRGIDQLLPYPGDPTLHELWVQEAGVYVELAEAVNGSLERPVSFDYIWGDALEELRHYSPDLRVINLETSITRSNESWPAKGVHYRMTPDNVPCLVAAGIDVCTLSNNHVLDWGYAGLEETLQTLESVGIRFAGAGSDFARAARPASFDLGERGRVLVLSIGWSTSGIPLSWSAKPDRAGVNLVEDFSDEAIARIREQLDSLRRPGDLVVASVHWGPNWGFDVPDSERKFAHHLIDEAGVHLVHGHSSHHVKGIEVHHDHLILYGCGDFIDDYEGISGYEKYRGDLGLMYFADLAPGTGRLERLRMTPTRTRRMRVNFARGEDANWLMRTLNEQCRRFGTSVRLDDEGRFELQYRQNSG